MTGHYIRRFCLGLDIEKYSSHPLREHEDAQRRLVDIAEYARRRARAGVSWRQSSGDGLFLVMRPGLDEVRAVPSLILGIQQALFESNRRPGSFGRIRVRAAIGQGPIAATANGFTGRIAIGIGRLLDARPTRNALEANPGSDLSLIVPDDIHQDLLAAAHPGLNAVAFTQAKVAVKEFTATAWVHSPPAGPAEDRGADRVSWPPRDGGGAFGVAAAIAAPAVVWDLAEAHSRDERDSDDGRGSARDWSDYIEENVQPASRPAGTTEPAHPDRHDHDGHDYDFSYDPVDFDPPDGDEPEVPTESFIEVHLPDLEFDFGGAALDLDPAEIGAEPIGIDGDDAL